MIRRINLFGGPCSGKSTTAAHVYSQLKRRGLNVDICRECAMMWVYEGRPITYFDGLTIFSTQLRNEDVILRGGVKYVINDSPIQLPVCYAKYNRQSYWEHLVGVAREFETHYPSINLFLRRGKAFLQDGRIHNEQESKEIDDLILNNVPGWGYELIEFDYDDWKNIVSFILEVISVSSGA